MQSHIIIDMIEFMNTIKTLLLYTFLIHTFSFILEIIYQKYCYPISAIGYITSLVTANSNVCILLNDNIQFMNSILSNRIFVMVFTFRKIIQNIYS